MKYNKKKRNKVRPDGRSATSFDNCLCKLPVIVQRHPAFQTLTAAQIRVLLLIFTKYDNSKYHMRRDDQGRYVFNFTHVEARRELSVSSATFSTALQELERRGFIEITVAGGLKGANGVPNVFTVIDNWKMWKMPEQLSEARLKKQKATLARLHGSDARPP